MLNEQTIKNYVNQNLTGFSHSKRLQISRLLCEIAKREKIDFKNILEAAPNESQRFLNLKQYLINRRYPSLSSEEIKACHSMPELATNSDYGVDLTGESRAKFTPKHFIVEESVLDSDLVNRLKQKFPQAKYTVTTKYRDYVGKKKFTIADYNQRLETFFIVREKYDFFKRCPCSMKSVGCGYHLINLGCGCAFECTYCFLQNYVNSPGIILPANIGDFFKQFDNYKQNVRIGSGEFTDSLVFDHITEFSPLIIEFFRQHPKSIFEFKTKSNNIQNLLSTPPADNVLVSWSINPQRMIDENEFYAASLKERLAAARECVKAGYNVTFHFDPIIYYKNWEEDYAALVKQLFDEIDDEKIVWLSLGILRMPPGLKKVIENRFPENTILDGELFPGYDDKLRYNERLRKEIYQKMIKWIRSRSKKVNLYLCMEEKEMCKTCGTKQMKN